MSDPITCRTINCCDTKGEEPIERPHTVWWQNTGQPPDLWAMCDWHHTWILTRFWKALVEKS